MKRYLASASLIAGLSMLSAPAFAQATGNVGVNYTRADFGSGDTDAYGVSGQAAIPTSGNMAILLDGNYSHNDDADTDVLLADAHLIVRDAGSAWGGFVGVANIDAGGSSTAYGIGGEWAGFFDTSTLALSVAYGTDDDTNVDAWGVNGVYRIFANDNLRFDLGAGWARVDAGGGDNDATQLGAGVEYRFDNSPISLGAAYNHVDAGSGSDADIFGLSLKFDFGTGSLKARDRSGNTFGGFGDVLGFVF